MASIYASVWYQVMSTFQRHIKRHAEIRFSMGKLYYTFELLYNSTF